MMPEWPACAEAPPGDPLPDFPGADAYDYVLAWLEATAGVPATEFTADYAEIGAWGEPDVLTTVGRVQTLPPERQQAWLEHNLSALEACDVMPHFEP